MSPIAGASAAVPDPMAAGDAVPTLVAWACVWNPLLARDAKRASWEALGLPGPIDEIEPDCWRVFHAALAAPAVPLLLHCLVGVDGGHAREDWLRAIHHLGLAWNGRVLPPDHLAIACEVLAAALADDEVVLVRELCLRYLDPWCAAATACLEDEPLAGTLVAAFRADLAALPR